MSSLPSIKDTLDRNFYDSLLDSSRFCVPAGEAVGRKYKLGKNLASLATHLGMALPTDNPCIAYGVIANLRDKEYGGIATVGAISSKRSHTSAYMQVSQHTLAPRSPFNFETSLRLHLAQAQLANKPHIIGVIEVDFPTRRDNKLDAFGRERLSDFCDRTQIILGMLSTQNKSWLLFPNKPGSYR